MTPSKHSSIINAIKDLIELKHIYNMILILSFGKSKAIGDAQSCYVNPNFSSMLNKGSRSGKWEDVVAVGCGGYCSITAEKK